MGVTAPLRREHQELLPHIEALCAVAEAAEGDRDTLVKALDDTLTFLERHLIPHAQAEDAVLYPKVEQVMRAPGATATMRRDHEEVVELTRRLRRLRDGLTGPPSSGPLSSEQRRGLQRLLYGLHAVVRLHFAKEEEVYLPLLDAELTAEDAAAMFQAMHGSASLPS
ncbi:hemerythrin domain-containing protein [Nonomuraea rhodomycinica]|uniref:Hemerythrin domain-containing protein n=1 Tax=Nonomuraea rhodomycinica TaxID=1712872 RepID=A0A7Y6IJL5_9ACTN|nr:hemerythrin domain-containing protein [Nonomuraea rhodomycinica]NUW39479.1 hemerythrin domain-containing protein [Nonomuraea rhodomycinica]